MQFFHYFPREQEDTCGKVVVSQNFEDALKKINTQSPEVETVWVIGGHSVYKVTLVKLLAEFFLISFNSFYSIVHINAAATSYTHSIYFSIFIVLNLMQWFQVALQSEYLHRIYLTKIMKDIECDVFFPSFNTNNFRLVK